MASFFLAYLLTTLLGIFFFPKNSDSHIYCLRVWISFDQFLNTVTGGHQDHTFSGRAGLRRMEGHPTWAFIANFIDFLFRDPNHCNHAIERMVVTSDSYRELRQLSTTRRILLASTFLLAAHGATVLFSWVVL